MSGHSKWSQIKRKKQTKDKQKGNIFSKLSRTITLAVIEGGGITDPENNFKLRLAIEKAKLENMPKENIKRAIENGLGPNKANFKEAIYEAFGPAKIALLITAATDNPNRTLSEIRSVLDKNEGKLGVNGSVAYLFKKCGLVIFDKKTVSENDIFSFAEKINAFDIEEDKDNFSVYFPFENLGRIKDYLGNISPKETEIDYKPLSLIRIEDKEEANKILKLVDELESLDEVQRVYSNFDIPDEFLN
ncbi:MAG: YebC/PmpR family DNA-binding transcriptional regulator [Microgenomates group bacterium]|nr:YebC/PmpR family DNA-binding transcriptional regulator [Microgenomates group bacterium]